MRHLLYSVQRPDVVKCVDAGRQTSMKTKDLIVDQSSQRKVVEKVREGLPDICISILPQTFIVETIDLSDLA